MHCSSIDKQIKSSEPIDLLIVTAVKDEYDAVLQVDTGAAPGSTWKRMTASTGLELSIRSFCSDSGFLRVGVTQALGMGGVEAVASAAQLIGDHSVRCLGMCGVCAGRKGEVNLGDVIIADRLWHYDSGKLKVEIDSQGNRVQTEKEDIEMYRIHPPAWKQDAERYAPNSNVIWLTNRPRSYEAQGNWLLHLLVAGGNPNFNSEISDECPDYSIVLDRLWKNGLVAHGTITPTGKGEAYIREISVRHRGILPAQPAFQIHLGPIASGNMVVEDPTIFDRLSTNVRKVIGLEMEAAAISGLAHARQTEAAVVMKGVMDFADSDKNDNFKRFAARASAECLIEFVRLHLPSRSSYDPRNDELEGLLNKLEQNNSTTSGDNPERSP